MESVSDISAQIYAEPARRAEILAETRKGDGRTIWEEVGTSARTAGN